MGVRSSGPFSVLIFSIHQQHSTPLAISVSSMRCCCCFFLQSSSPGLTLSESPSFFASQAPPPLAPLLPSLSLEALPGLGAWWSSPSTLSPWAVSSSTRCPAHRAAGVSDRHLEGSTSNPRHPDSNPHPPHDLLPLPSFPVSATSSSSLPVPSSCGHRASWSLQRLLLPSHRISSPPGNPLGFAFKVYPEADRLSSPPRSTSWPRATPLSTSIIATASQLVPRIPRLPRRPSVFPLRPLK